MAVGRASAKSQRLVSIDAYRGFVMLAMASAGFGFANVVQHHSEEIGQMGQRSQQIWSWLAYEFSHVEWTGCSFWDLIQPSFMFIVGVAMPFSQARRWERGESSGRMLMHAFLRAFILVALGVFLASNSHRQERTNFEFTNVLCQIGLGYVFVYLLLGRKFLIQSIALVVILSGYWSSFFWYQVPDAHFDVAVAPEIRKGIQADSDWDQFSDEKYPKLAAHWNKHDNFAAKVDRKLLNLKCFPRNERYWYNRGGYQTLNFIPSMATMLFGLLAGQLLLGGRRPSAKFFLLLLSGLGLLIAGMAIDHTIWPNRFWPTQLEELVASTSDQNHSYFSRDWTLCPIVKRIWTPSWAIFSAGWTLVLLAFFYLVIDVMGFRKTAFPLAVVGMNSIAMYMMAQLLKPWIWLTLEKHFGHFGWEPFGEMYSPIVERVLVLFVLWLVCVWLYRRRIFIRI